MRLGFERTYCDSTGEALSGGLWFWCFMFYLSKYWEYVDTMILVLKKSEVKLLHSWHHFVVVWICFLFMKYNVSFFFSGVLWNAGIHTIMYFYYYLTTFGMKPWWGKNLTKAQMFQFFAGGISFWPMLVFCWQDLKSWLPIYLGNQAMLISFLWLFGGFFVKKYNKGEIKKE